MTPYSSKVEPAVCATIAAPPLTWDGGRRIKRAGLTSLSCRTPAGALLVVLPRRHELVALLPRRGAFVDAKVGRRGSAIAYDPDVCRAS